ncbi:LacI family DNA-binding transcriptional regulator [Micromonospora sp. NPDC051300]|uniref:LacI family DNA-binding transcriptional regulator n=1 Tax=Micromonospora sp. NPDC051300 TaxID=3364286 RepID=UPI0037BDBC16
MRTPGRPTLQDVADLAGVSMGTASSVFSRRQPVADRTREAVLRAAAEIGYRPRRRLGTLDVRGLSTIGLLARPANYPGPKNQYSAQVLQGAQRAAADLGLTMTYEVLSADAGGPRLPLMVERREVQGLLVLGGIELRLLERVLRAGVPCVLIDHTVDDLLVDSVRADDRRGGALATAYLLRLGHRNPAPAFIGGGGSISSRDRAAGYRAALAAFGFLPDPAYVHEASDVDTEAARQAMNALLDLPRPPTAVFCGSDTAAFGAMQILRDRRVSVPRKCSVVGFDDIDLATTTVPALTTVRVDKHLLGAQGVWHLVQRIRQPQMPRRVTYADVNLTVRGSAAPATASTSYR